MASKTYTVKLTLVLNEDASHPRKWLNDAIAINLESDEYIYAVEIEEVEEKVVDSSTS